MTNTVTLRDVYVQDAIHDIAEELNVSVIEENNVTKIHLPKKVAEGTIKATQFASGIGFIETDYTANDDINFNLRKNAIQPLKVIFNIGNTILYRLAEDDEFVKLRTGTGVIIASANIKKQCFTVKEGQRVKLLSIEINRKIFEHKLENFIEKLNERLNTLLRDVNGVNVFRYEFEFGKEIKNSIVKIYSTTESGFLGALHKESLAYDLLMKAFSIYVNNNDSENGTNGKWYNKNDLVREISLFIEDNIEDLPTIRNIAERFEVSEPKMQGFFREYYNCSVNEFVQNKRLEMVRVLLEETDMNITEIAYKVGISSKSYISKIFKDRYGVSPSKYRDSEIATKRFY